LDQLSASAGPDALRNAGARQIVKIFADKNEKIANQYFSLIDPFTFLDVITWVLGSSVTLLEEPETL